MLEIIWQQQQNEKKRNEMKREKKDEQRMMEIKHTQKAVFIYGGYTK